MRYSTLCIMLLLAACSPVAEQTTSHTAVRIVSHTPSIHTNQRSRHLITGEVINASTKPVYHVQIQAKYFDGLERPLAEMTTIAALQLLQPGQRSPFSIVLSADLPLISSIEHYDLIVASSAAPTESAEVHPLTIADPHVEVADLQTSQTVSIAGEVTNTSKVAVGSLRVVGTVYDERGDIVAYGHSEVLAADAVTHQSLSIKETTQFSLSTGLHVDESTSELPDGYSFIVQAEGYN